MKRGSYGIENCEECNARCGAALRRVEEIRERLGGCVRRRMAQAHMRLMNGKKGQGTTEYGVLVGVLVVIGGLWQSRCFAQKSRSCGMRSPTA